MLEVQTVVLHFALRESGLFGKDILVRGGLGEFPIHVGQPGLNTIPQPIEIAGAGLDRILLRLIERLLELVARLIHGLELVLQLRLLLAGCCRIEGSARGCTAHIAGSCAQLIERLIAGAVLIALGRGCLGMEAIALHLAGAVESPKTGAVTHAAGSPLCLAARCATPSTSTTARTLCKKRARS